MCDPVTLLTAGLVMSVGSNVAGFVGQNKTAKRNAQNATEAAVLDYEQIGLRQMEEDAAASAQLEQSRLEALQARSSAEVAAGEAGVAGQSVNQLLGAISAAQGRNANIIESNLKARTSQLNVEQQAVRTTAQGRINAVPRGSLAGMLFDIGSESVGHLTQFAKARGKDT